MMTITETFRNTYRGMGRSIQRYPTTVLFLITVAFLNSLMIENTTEDYTRYLFSFFIGAAFSAVGQMLVERFSLKPTWRYCLMAVSILVASGYYFIVGPPTQYNLALEVKTSVVLFAMLIAFIWIPTIDSIQVPFHRSLLSALKALFISLVFSGVLTIGISAIFYATDYLLFNIDGKFLVHLLNPIGSLFAPIYFLSMTPLFPSKGEELIPDEAWSKKGQILQQQFRPSRFLELMISYIIIPLTAIYTLILVVYLALNIRGDFWSDNLLEPLLVTYTILVIIVALLAHNLDNKFAVGFRTVFPKILVPIVIFQTIASFLKIDEMGVTHGRYYVILFGIFATAAGLILSFLKPRQHGWIAITLLVVSAISIVPPIDAFTVSKNSQLGLLEEKLIQHDMLVANEIVPKNDLPASEKIILTKVASYIDNMGYNDEVVYLPDDFNVFQDFKSIYGFDMTYSEREFPQGEGEYVFLNWDNQMAIGIQGFDSLIHQSLYYTEGDSEELDPIEFEVDGQVYQFERKLSEDYYLLAIRDDRDQVLITYNTEDLYDSIFSEDNNLNIEKANLTIEDAVVSTENNQVRINILVNSLERSSNFKGGDVYLFIEIK